MMSGTSHYHEYTLTYQGTKLRQRAIAEGLTVDFTRGAIGIGQPAPETDIFFMTGLIEHELNVPVKESYAENTNHIMAVVIDNTNPELTRELLMTEIGIFARLLDSEGNEVIPEALYGYTYTDKYDYVPLPQNYALSRTIYLNTMLSRSSNVTITFDRSRVYATQEDLNNLRIELLSIDLTETSATEVPQKGVKYHHKILKEVTGYVTPVYAGDITIDAAFLRDDDGNIYPAGIMMDDGSVQNAYINRNT